MIGRLFWRQLVVLLVAFSLCMRADAQALPAFTGVVNKVLGKVIQQTGLRRGFAANDPRMATTMTGAATVAASVAADVALTAATAASAPVWLSVAAGLGAAAVVGGLAYGAYKLFFDDSSSQAGFTVQKPATGGGTAPSGTVVSAPAATGEFTGQPDPRGYNQPVYSAGGIKIDSTGAVVNSSGATYVAGAGWGSADKPYDSLYVGSHPYYYRGYAFYCGTLAECKDAITYIQQNIWGGTPTFSVAQNNSTLETFVNGSFYVVFDMTPNSYGGSPSQTVKGTISDIVGSMDSSELAKPADAATVAFVANALWQRAASQPGYQGLPYSASDPVTTADASAVQASDPSSWPKNSDLVAPVAQAANQPVPIGDAATSNPSEPSTGIGTNVNVVNNPGVTILNTPNVHLDGAVDVNWGQAPSVNQPTIEADTPTAQQIVAPIINLMSGLRTFVVPSHSSECPMPSFELFGKTMVMDTHCKVLEPVRPTLYAVMAFVWVVVGTFIVLRA